MTARADSRRPRPGAPARLARRAFLALAAALVLAAFLPGAAAAGRDEAPRRALWVVRDGLLSPAAIHRMVDDAAAAGITDLIVQVRGRGDAYYETDLAPTALPLRDAWSRYGRFDPLALVLERAHRRGIRVHAWLNVYLVASFTDVPPGHVVTTHPEWVLEDPRGTPMTEMSEARLRRELTEGAYLDPSRPEVVRAFTAIVRDLAGRYPIDGVHLDYVRYPHLDGGYTDAMRAGFRRRTGVDPLELAFNREGLRRERGEAGLRSLETAWSAWRAEQVTALVHDVRYALRAVRPGTILSAAVKPDPEAALSKYGQDWVSWIRDDLIDVAAPMMYSKSTATVETQVALSARVVPPGRVWAGIAVYNQSLAGAEAKIDIARRAGLGGVSIFSYNSLPGGGRSLSRLTR